MCKNLRDRHKKMGNQLALEMQRITRAAAEPWQAGDSVKAGIRRAARQLRLGYRRAETFWYGHPCAVRAEEADRLRAIECELLCQRRLRLEREIHDIKARLNARENPGADTGGAPAGATSVVDR